MLPLDALKKHQGTTIRYALLYLGSAGLLLATLACVRASNSFVELLSSNGTHANFTINVSAVLTLWCTFPRQPGFETGDAFETHGTDVSLQFLNSHERSWIFIYERLNEPTRERVSYSESDVEALATRWGDLPIGEKLRVKDIFSQHYTAGMANLEEGIVQH